jgi:hypothetical protein
LYVLTASLATSASYYPAQTIQTTVASASWVSASAKITTADTASYVSASNIVGTISFSTNSTSASWASSSVSASYAPVQPSYSASVSNQFGTKQDTLVTGNTYTITSSWSNNTLTASAISFVPLTSTSSSWASSSVRSSYPWVGNGTASYSATGITKVGILTSNPVTTLHVVGNYVLIDNEATYYNSLDMKANSTIFRVGKEGDSGGNLMVGSLAGAGIISVVDASALQLGTNNNARITILSDGKTGIGTVAPGATLHVQGNISASSITASLLGTSSWAENAVNGGTTLGTGSTYPITSSWSNNSISSSYAVTASYAKSPIVPYTLTDAATIATDINNGNHFRVTLEGNRTLGNPTNGKDGERILWEFIQDATGSRTITLGTAFLLSKDIPSVTLTTESLARDYMSAVYNSSRTAWDVVSLVRGYNATGSSNPMVDSASYALVSDDAVTASYSLTASYLTSYQPYSTLVTSSTNGVTASFGSSRQQLLINVAGVYTFAVSNLPSSGQYADTILYISNSVNATSSLSFPATWENYTGGWPTSIAAYSSSIVWLSAMDTTKILGTYVSK